jgi:hypothetical protein
MRCTPVRYTPMRCTPVRCTPIRCTPDDVHAREVHAYEVHTREMHAHKMHACEMHACEVYAYEFTGTYLTRIPMCHHHPPFVQIHFNLQGCSRNGQTPPRRMERDGRRCTRVPLGSSTEVCTEGNMKKRKCCLTLNGAGNLELGIVS